MRIPARSSILMLLALGAVLLACSSESAPGEGCDVPGGTADVCEPGTVCGKPVDDAVGLACIYVCADDRDCPPDHDCKGVEGTSLKGCRFKD